MSQKRIANVNRAKPVRIPLLAIQVFTKVMKVFVKISQLIFLKMILENVLKGGFIKLTLIVVAEKLKYI